MCYGGSIHYCWETFLSHFLILVLHARRVRLI
jgi:hypothetical protein